MDFVEFFDLETDNLLASLDENDSKIDNNETGLVQESSKERFPRLTEDEVESFYAKANCRNTSRTTKTWLNTYLSWAETHNQRQDIENLSPVNHPTFHHVNSL